MITKNFSRASDIQPPSTKIIQQIYGLRRQRKWWGVRMPSFRSPAPAY
jgi:hypothetical protein